MKNILTALLLAFTTIVNAKDYIVPTMDVGLYFATLPEDATVLIFSEAVVYSSEGDIVLPSRSLIIDGNMCRLNLGPNSNGFVASVTDQADANTKIERKFIIRNFSKITGGKKAIDLSATFMSRVEDVELVSQTECAIDLRFCLMATAQNLKITLNRYDGIRVRNGDWPGAGVSNSQSNSTTLDRVRIYNGPTANRAFTFQHANSGRMVQCVSEGYGPEYDLWLDASSGTNPVASNPVVKQFSCDGLHVEHGAYQAKSASVWVNMPSKCSIRLSRMYWNYVPNKPVIEYTMGALVLSDIGWWTIYHYISSRIQSPRIHVYDSHDELKRAATVTNNRCGSFRLSDNALPGNVQLTPAYVTITQPNI